MVLVPLRGGSPVGALRFDLGAGDPARAARVWIGALGRLGPVDRLAIAVFSRRGRSPSTVELVSALSTRALRTGLAVEVLVAAGSPHPLPLGGAGAALTTPGDAVPADLLPVVGREETLAVAAEVDALLDRHPSARLPDTLAAEAESLLLRSVSGRPWQPRTRALAVLVVCAQRSEWRERVMGLLSASGDGAARSVLDPVARAAAVAPATERSPLLVLLATLHWWCGLVASAAVLAREAARLDPHDHAARVLVAALDRGEPSTGRAGGRLAA